MTLSLPPSYVPVPVSVIEEAYKPDKPHRALFTSFIRLLALAWQNKYESTPRILEEELYNTINADGSTKYGYLKMSRREYFIQKREMELLGWLRSTRPAPGFVQFHFSRSIIAPETVSVSAENRTDVQKTAPLMIEEEDSLNLMSLKDSESSSSSSQTQVQKNAPAMLQASEKKMQLLVENLRLLFEPERHGILEMRESFLAGIPERALGWIAKAYQDCRRLDNPIGMIVKHINAQDAPDRYYMESFVQILPEEYLEAVGEIEYECAWCDEQSQAQSRFGTRAGLQQHQNEKHPYPCSECDAWFMTQEEITKHFEDHHLIGRDVPGAVRFVVDDSVSKPVHEGNGSSVTPEQAWQSVLGQLQMEMPRAAFDTWVRDTRPVRYGRNTLTIGVRNAYARDWLESRLASTVSRLLVGIMNDSVAVEFVTADMSEVES